MTDSNGFLKRSERGRFAKGTPPGPGRRKGTPNRTSADLRVIRDAFGASWVRVNGDAILDQIARDDPARYVELVCKVLPRAVELRDDKATAQIVVNMIAEAPRPATTLVHGPASAQLPPG